LPRGFQFALPLRLALGPLRLALSLAALRLRL
jgi:hypothetical protein